MFMHVYACTGTFIFQELLKQRVTACEPTSHSQSSLYENYFKNCHILKLFSLFFLRRFYFDFIKNELSNVNQDFIMEVINLSNYIFEVTFFLLF